MQWRGGRGPAAPVDPMRARPVHLPTRVCSTGRRAIQQAIEVLTSLRNRPCAH